MKVILILCGLILMAGGSFLWRQTRLPTEYGSFTEVPKAKVADLIERPKNFIGKNLLIEGEVRKQCTTMGCYFFFGSDERLLRIDIAEIAMKAPRKNGHRARVEGQIVPYQDGYQFWASAIKFD